MSTNVERVDLSVILGKPSSCIVQLNDILMILVRSKFTDANVMPEKRQISFMAYHFCYLFFTKNYCT